MYNRLCNGLTDKGKLIPSTEDFSQYIDTEKDFYTSIYQYNEKQKETFDQQGTIKGITNVTTNLLVFDFDSEDDIELARRETSEMIDRLRKRGISDKAIDTYTSGSKGFHIIVKTDQQFTPIEAKTIALNLAEGLSTIDSRVYNASRIFRVANTKHPSSGLYKRQIIPSVLQQRTVKELQQIAAKPSTKLVNKEVAKMPRSILQLKSKAVKQVQEEKSKTFIAEGLDLSQKPDNMSPWKYALSMGFFPSGTRHEAVMILMSTYRALKYKKEQAYRLVKAACEYQANRFKQDKFDNEEIWQAADSVFDPSWQGGSYSEDNFPLKLQKYLTEDLQLPRREEEKLEVFENTGSVFKAFTDFAENIDKNTIKTGIKAIDDSVRMTTGMLCGLLGAPSSGKTSCSLEILRNTSLNGEKAAFFSMDMGASLVFQRVAQKLTGQDSDKLFRIFKQKQQAQIKDIQNRIEENYSNVYFSFKTALTVEDIKKSLLYQQQKTGEKIRLVVIDYLECISASISDPTAKISMISQQLKDLAIDLDCCVLLLLQPPKRVGDPRDPILSYNDIKGSATVAQACSIVISLWREGFNPQAPELDNFMSFGVLKNRLGGLTQVDCAFEGLTGNVTELDDNGRLELKRLRSVKKLNEDNDI